MTKLINKSLSVQVAEELEKKIVSGEFPVGTKIPSEIELMDLFGVSRNTVREAVRSLAIAGVIDIRQGDGTYVMTQTAFSASMKRRLQKEDIVYIIETRQVIEPAIMEIAATKRTNSELKQLEICFNNIQNSFYRDFSSYIKNDIKFHLLLANMAHNPLLADLYRAIAEYMPQFVKEGFFTFKSDDIKLFLHKDLFKHIQDGDGKNARAITEYMIKREIDILKKTNVI